jgi:MoxR-like ATPase
VRVTDRDHYEALLDALGICIAARVPFLLWGDPGEGKTSVIESAAAQGWHVETVIVSHHEPSDFAGLPVVGRDGTVTLAPPAWAQRLASHPGPSLAFFDEWTTAAPAVQAAALRPLTHHEVGALRLPQTVSFGAAANPADVATAGWELAAPTANRFCHLDWSLPLEVYAECLVAGSWPGLTMHRLPATVGSEVALARALVAGYLRARRRHLSAIPADAASRGRAFPTPRTWDHAARLLGTARAVGVSDDAATLLVAGSIGAATAHEFLVWVRAQQLPDPEQLLADPDGTSFAGMRPDRVFAVLSAVLSAVVSDPSPQRWSAGVQLCSTAAAEVGVDPAVPVVRALLRPGVRPAGTPLPAGIVAFAAPLALAGMLEPPAA